MDWWPPVTVAIADANQVMQDELPRPIALAALATLSADPETLDDFITAHRRFFIGRDWKWPDRRPVANPPQELIRLLAAPPDDLLLLHLPSRIISATDPDQFPLCATIPLIRDHSPASQSLLYGLRPDWNPVPFEKAASLLADPDVLAEAERRINRGIEARRVLYCDLLGWIAKQRLDGCSDTPVDLHRRWLMTSQAALQDRSPRQVIFEYFSFIDRDLEYQQHNWNVTRIQPPALDRCSASYLAAPFGRVELTVYHLLVRHLIESHDRQFGRSSHSGDPNELTRRIDWLHQRKQTWWKSPLDNYDDRTPEEMADGERRRIPLTMDPDKMADCDCPICRALAYEGPMFVILDTPPLEEEFAFSYCETKKEWVELRELWGDPISEHDLG